MTLDAALWAVEEAVSQDIPLRVTCALGAEDDTAGPMGSAPFVKPSSPSRRPIGR
ncbi:hypothetical protein [Mycobacterium heckeshornense]|uniref:hypothetical protein n=1 Tax=Mycobacterium heckeshornense TaxID=110505 RepID=UPI001364C5B7|nr:hypothetical protein [Mycobacterium heckeshornense]MCV7035973.1 hypothetical protein [Mycobacterium heckeshornense]